MLEDDAVNSSTDEVRLDMGKQSMLIKKKKDHLNPYISVLDGLEVASRIIDNYVGLAENQEYLIEQKKHELHFLKDVGGAVFDLEPQDGETVEEAFDHFRQGQYELAAAASAESGEIVRFQVGVRMPDAEFLVVAISSAEPPASIAESSEGQGGPIATPELVETDPEPEEAPKVVQDNSLLSDGVNNVLSPNAVPGDIPLAGNQNPE